MVIIMDVHSSDHGHGCLPIVTNDTGTFMTTTTTTTTNISYQPPPTTPKKSLGILAEAAALKRQEDLKIKTEIDEKSNKIHDKDTILQSHPSSTEVKETIITTITTATTTTSTMNPVYTLKQIKKFCEKRLLSTFVEYKKDIKTKRCSYRCQMLPSQCQMKLDCFIGADQEIKTQILEHLHSHLCNLETTQPNIRLSSFRKKKIRKNNNNNNNNTGKKSAPPLPASTTKTPTIIAKKTNVVLKSEDNNNVVVDIKPLIFQPKEGVTLFQDHAYSCNETFKVSNVVVDNNKLVEMNKMGVDIVESKNFVTVINAAAAAAPANVMETTAVIEGPPKVENISQTVDMIGSDLQSQQQRVRALALLYIDDIRKKNSSSMPKSVGIKNGSKKNIIYKCKICPDKQFTSTNGLVFHYKKHAGLKPYVCDLCGATFTRQHSLNYHMLIHLNKSRFVCSECSRHFRHPSHFKEHMRRHTGETPFQCEDCLIRFKTRNTYKRHLQTKHSKILTSKGIIELSTAEPLHNKDDNNKKTSKVVASKGGGGGTTTTTMTKAANKSHHHQQQQASTSVMAAAAAVAPVSKPRRKYAINYLHENIKSINKFDEHQFHHQQQQQPTTATFIANIGAAQANHGQTTAIAATAQTAPGSNITILSIPQLPTVHILDNNGGSTVVAGGGGVVGGGTATPVLNRPTAIARKTTALLNYGAGNNNNYQQQNQPCHQMATATPALQPGQPTNITILSVSPYHHQQQHHHHYHQDHQQSNMITELTSAVPLVVTTTITTSQTPSSSSTTAAAAAVYQIHDSTATPTLAAAATTATPAPNNDNFMRLLEAIAITEVGKE